MYFIGMLFAYLKVHGFFKGTIPHGNHSPWGKYHVSSGFLFKTNVGTSKNEEKFSSLISDMY
ncbi:hypothetical protein CQ056_26500 [Peribacillus simplex]|nr:hypothetical protein CQ056_26500 [Peribacillus simplex]